MKNNLFNFATKELSQDAFLCWCLNWYNNPESVLYPMAEELLGVFGGNGLPQGQELEIWQQIKKIDILVILKKQNRAIIIEDKTTSSEHDGQISRYREMIKCGLSKQEQETLGINSSVEIRTVYFKTGFHYDCDRETVADIKVDGQTFLKILEKYTGWSEILDDYVSFLRESLDWYDKYGRYDVTNPADDFWNWNISRYHIAQHNFMCDMLREHFPESKWEQENELYKIRNGTNIGGRPWTEMTFVARAHPDSKDKYYLFWRIDTDGNGPYISLRFYEKFQKSDEAQKERHAHAYEIFRENAQEFLAAHSKLGLCWDDVKGRNTKSRYESTILTICLNEVLMKWENKADTVKRQILAITEYFRGEGCL